MAEDFELTTFAPAGGMDLFKDLTEESGKDYIPAIKLLQGLSKEVAEPTEDLVCAVGDFVWDKNNLGKEFKCVPIGYRAKAIKFVDNALLWTLYDQTHPEFKKALADKKGVAGPEFLLWLPDFNGFGTYHFTKTARRHAGTVQACSGKPCVIKSVLVKTKKFSWRAPNTFVGNFEFKNPSKEALEEATKIFQNAKSDDVTSGDSGSERAR